MRRGIVILLGEIIEAIDLVTDYTEGLEFAEFAANVEKQDSVIRRLEIIGEAVKGNSGACSGEALHRSLARHRRSARHPHPRVFPGRSRNGVGHGEEGPAAPGGRGAEHSSGSASRRTLGIAGEWCVKTLKLAPPLSVPATANSELGRKVSSPWIRAGMVA